MENKYSLSMEILKQIKERRQPDKPQLSTRAKARLVSVLLANGYIIHKNGLSHLEDELYDLTRKGEESVNEYMNIMKIMEK